MAILATRRRWLVTRWSAASGSPCSRHLLNRRNSSSGVISGNLWMSRRYRRTVGSKDARVTVILLCSERAGLSLPRWAATPPPSDPVVPRPLARPRQVDPYLHLCAAVLA